MAEWNPSLYSRFEDERTRPARELLARVPLGQARLAVDLGCGPGNSTELIVARFPDATVIGTDNSKPMLESAGQRLPGVRFDLSDIASWQPETPPDLVYANASLQWVPGHETLIPRLFASLAPGGVLAVQMPDNRDEPTHRAMREVGALQPWAECIGDLEKLRTAILPLAAYYDMLAPQAAAVDVWHTVYQHPMDSAQAIVDWVSGTGLKPFVAPLGPELEASYRAEYLRRIEASYPPRSDGRRLLAFPRMFIVAQRKA
ncbi:trans-aconitate 2-methyltransferase [Xylophilus sp. GOD-11R]|uniref:trans-aconitate 2-methyltransferase n=1 Tax=Xylophilus sp. GOD-11R TaxID=3089814 RepID=UPI00298C4553|nr:trans-aconitate 2-methyltransferase [Xylophilus sp. GOD-11R]WPB58523.1 trans-aconitate 2-methyltransferase [Xylophilus sp. GOD-11R]